MLVVQVRLVRLQVLHVLVVLVARVRQQPIARFAAAASEQISTPFPRARPSAFTAHRPSSRAANSFAVVASAKMPDRAVDVWYPVDPASVTTKKKATYDQATPLPENLKGLVPPKYNTVVTMNAYKDVPASDDSPFPVLLFSHGFGGYRMANSALTAGVASWGYVVVSVDYEERGIQTEPPASCARSPEKRQERQGDTGQEHRSDRVVDPRVRPQSSRERTVDRDRMIGPAGVAQTRSGAVGLIR